MGFIQISNLVAKVKATSRVCQMCNGRGYIEHQMNTLSNNTLPPREGQRTYATVCPTCGGLGFVHEWSLTAGYPTDKPEG